MLKKIKSLAAVFLLGGALTMVATSCTPRMAANLLGAAIVGAAIVGAASVLAANAAPPHSELAYLPKRWYRGRWVYHYRGRWVYWSPHHRRWYYYRGRR